LVKDAAEMLGVGPEALEEPELEALADELLELEELLPHAATTMLAQIATAAKKNLLFSKRIDVHSPPRATIAGDAPPGVPAA
jgi:hypothetical protein